MFAIISGSLGGDKPSESDNAVLIESLGYTEMCTKNLGDFLWHDYNRTAQDILLVPLAF